MATYTQNYNLKKPATTDIVNINDFNTNADLLDSIIGGVAEKTFSIHTGTGIPSASLGANKDFYFRKIGSSGTKKISTLVSGDMVKLKENGVLKKFIFLGHNHYGKSEVTLLRKDIVGLGAFNAGSSGYNPYIGSSSDMYCNVTYPQTLDPIVQASMIPVPIPVIQGHIMSADTMKSLKSIQRKGFSLSLAEVSAASNEVDAMDGTAFSYFSTNTSRVSQFELSGEAYGWWSRSPLNDGVDRNCGFITPQGAIRDNDPTYLYGLRPAVTLSPALSVSSTTDSDGCYTIVGAAAVETYHKLSGTWMRMV